MKIAAISVGHSLKDCGAVAPDGTKEYDLNVKLTQQIMKYPLEYGKWQQIDKLCEDFPYPQHLYCTVRQVRQTKNVVCGIEIHHNSCPNRNAKGGQVIYWDHHTPSKILADCITFYLRNVGLFDFNGFDFLWRTARKFQYTSKTLATLKHIRRRLYYLRKLCDVKTPEVAIPSVIVEPGFISNSWDLSFVQDHRESIAWAIGKGVDLWLANLGK